MFHVYAFFTLRGEKSIYMRKNPENSMAAKIGVGLIGYGAIGRLHALCYRWIPAIQAAHRLIEAGLLGKAGLSYALLPIEQTATRPTSDLALHQRGQRRADRSRFASDRYD